jgi:hypothetical protein
MRWLRILVTGVLALAVAGAWGGVAYADGPAAGGFCDLARDANDALGNQGLGDLDLDDPDALGEVYDRAAEVMDELRSEAPKKLKRSFKIARNWYRDLGEVDLTDPRSAGDLVPTRKIQKAFAKITEYLVDECGPDIDSEDVGN